MKREITQEAYQDWHELVKCIAVNDEAVRAAVQGGDYEAFAAALRAEMPRILDRTYTVIARNIKRHETSKLYQQAAAYSIYTGLLREDFNARAEALRYD